jgi:subfamily B ATP-binding cassette protein MsbA
MIFLGVIVGVLDGLGLAMFMPLLEMVNNVNKATGSSLGKLRFLVLGMESVGLSLNLVSVLLVMIFFFIFKGLIKFFASIYNATLRKFFISKLRNHLLYAFNKISFKYFVTSDIGRIQNTMSVEIERAAAAFYNYANTLQNAVMVVVYVGFAFFVDIKFAMLVTIGGFLSNFLYKTIYKRTKGTSRKFTKDSHSYQGQIIQYVSNFKYLKATALLDLYGSRLQKNIISIEKSRFHIGKLNAILESVREPILIIVVAAVILIMAVELIQDSIRKILHPEATTSPETYSILPCPNGCSVSGFAPASLKPSSVTIEEPASERLLKASAVIAMELLKVPARNLPIKSSTLNNIPITPHSIPYASRCFILSSESLINIFANNVTMSLFLFYSSFPKCAKGQ